MGLVPRWGEHPDFEQIASSSLGPTHTVAKQTDLGISGDTRGELDDFGKSRFSDLAPYSRKLLESHTRFAHRDSRLRSQTSVCIL